VDWDLSRPGFVAYFIARTRPPTSTYEIDLPPGDYGMLARLDSDPLSAGAYITCHSSDCIPALSTIRLKARQAVTNVDIASWGSSSAANAIWDVDMFGSLMTIPPAASASATQSPSPAPLPVRQRPHGATPPLPVGRDLRSIYPVSHALLHLELPADWYEVNPPLRPGADEAIYYFANEDVVSPLGLDTNGVILRIEDFCPALDPSRFTAEASFFNTQQGMAHFYFLDRDKPSSGQPFEGYEYVGTKGERDACIFFEFAGVTGEARDSNLLLFDQIVFQARYV
jgi:hypothetical protein